MIEQSNDEALNDPYRRWWSRTVTFADPVTGSPITRGYWPLQLANGVTLSASLTDLANWTDVYGEPANLIPTHFQAALRNAQWVGFTCGGGSFAGHGVGLDSGSATFTLTAFSIQ
jgi:hypothetical protein